MSLLKGYPQIDSRDNSPSIIFSVGKPQNELRFNTTLDIQQSPIFYTDLFTYGMLYVPNFRATVENALNDSSQEYRVHFLDGFTPDSYIELGFDYNDYAAFLILNIYIYNYNSSDIVRATSRRLAYGSVEFIKDFLFTKNRAKIYLSLYPYGEINENSYFYLEQQVNKQNDINSVGFISYSLGNKYNVFKDFVSPKSEPLPDTPVGAPTGNNTDVGIDIPSLPSVSILDGLHHMYCPNSANVKKMGRALWSPNFFDNVVKVFANPSEAIVSLALSPIKPTVSENDYNIIVGNIELQTTTGVETSNVTAPILASQYGTYSFGDLPLYEKYSSYLDYNTTVQIYLPFIGTRELSVNDVMGKSLSLTYNVDFFTGDFIALLKCVDPYGTLKSVLYHWNGNLLSHLPISASDFSNGILSGLTTSLSIAGGIATGGATGTLSAVGGSLGSLGGFKPTVDKGGSTNSNVGMLDNFNAYLIVTKPIEDKPEEYNFIKGGTVNKNIKLTQGLGFVVCGELHLESIGNATSEEKTEIESLLKSGVIL